MKTLIEKLHSELVDDGDEVLKDLFAFVMQLFDIEDYKTVNDFLGKLEPSKMPPLFSLTALRGTYVRRSFLSNWVLLRTNTFAALEESGRNPNALMRGLFDAEDSKCEVVSTTKTDVQPMKHPDPTLHLYVSIAKSGLRILAGLALASKMFVSAGILFILAEILGIVEELV